ncbi:MAG: sulfotransferase [Nitrococcus mobilis]|nr:sulfotransferase [Nitrococcus mobilis]
MNDHPPVVIIGAPRSGTNMLRDVLTKLPSVATWPCDEINYIWRHGNVRYPSDEFTPAMATPRVQQYIRRQFDWVARRYNAQTVVEKTCANSLRVGFVDCAVPEARYVFIRRDGLDAVGSALKRWKATLDIPYLLQKARFVPPLDLPYYASRYFWNRIYRLISREQRLAFWGPSLDGMEALLARHTLEEVCALQWKRCVERAEAAFSAMPEGRVCAVSYEAFVRSPQAELQRIVEFLGLGVSNRTLTDAVAGVSALSVGKGRQELGDALARQVLPLIEDTQRRAKSRRRADADVYAQAPTGYGCRYKGPG